MTVPAIAFDADVLIYAAQRRHALGARVAALFTRAAEDEMVGTGSVLLLTEVLAKPMRDDPASDETLALMSLLSRLQLLPLDDQTARLALHFAIAYGLRAADATHLATAVAAGADRFLTNNQKDFPKTIGEVDITYPSDL
ncbi:type II toxin-antitoxin system VapC family toxin [Flexivirga oryzae]|uniref:Ribonuclease VapC n=1 Tax=Flexivirga oryzae TaxID=1794944 RepID=A0A839N403_9MICO|nr:PIN domain-containing protein [Flexivirga oryzae]MBB2892490.1 putative nucleic acid-binding protein [Flexivirga oryzae]